MKKPSKNVLERIKYKLLHISHLKLYKWFLGHVMLDWTYSTADKTAKSTMKPPDELIVKLYVALLVEIAEDRKQINEEKLKKK